MTGRRRHRDRLPALGRPRTSTLVLIGLFVGVFALYILVRPVSAADMREAPAAPSHQPYVPKTYSPSPTRTPSHSPTPSPHRTPVTPSPSRTTTPAISGTSGPTSPVPRGSPTA